jgi:hypothetical protein
VVHRDLGTGTLHVARGDRRMPNGTSTGAAGHSFKSGHDHRHCWQRTCSCRCRCVFGEERCTGGWGEGEHDEVPLPSVTRSLCVGLEKVWEGAEANSRQEGEGRAGPLDVGTMGAVLLSAHAGLVDGKCLRGGEEVRARSHSSESGGHSAAPTPSPGWVWTV